MRKIWTESPTGLRVDKEFLEKKAENREFLGNRDSVLPPLTKEYAEGWERIFGKCKKVQDMRRDEPGTEA